MLLVRDQPVDILERKRALKILVQEFSQSQSSVFRAVFTLRKGHAGWKGQAAMVTRMNVNKSLKTNERLSFRVFLVHFFRIHSQSFRLCSIQCSCPGGGGNTARTKSHSQIPGTSLWNSAAYGGKRKYIQLPKYLFIPEWLTSRQVSSKQHHYSTYHIFTKIKLCIPKGRKNWFFQLIKGMTWKHIKLFQTQPWNLIKTYLFLCLKRKW